MKGNILPTNTNFLYLTLPKDEKSSKDFPIITPYGRKHSDLSQCCQLFMSQKDNMKIFDKILVSKAPTTNIDVQFRQNQIQNKAWGLISQVLQKTPLCSYR